MATSLNNHVIKPARRQLIDVEGSSIQGSLLSELMAFRYEG